VAAKRNNPYGAFNFMVKLGTAGGDDQIVGGFSDVSGLDNEVKYSEYRNGNDSENHVRKVANINSTGNITFKRGVIGDLSLFTWLKDTREGNFDPRTVTVTLLDEGRSPVCSWILQQAQPQKWDGPTLTAKGGGDVAMETLVLVAERIDFQST
jgi:phage tail-like protein